VARVPQDDVLRRVEHAVERERELHVTEVRAEVTAILVDCVDDE